MISSHPAAELFPMLGPDELHELVEDIKKHGLLVPIVIADSVYYGGRWHGWFESDLDGLKEFMRLWVSWATRNPWRRRQEVVKDDLEITSLITAA